MCSCSLFFYSSTNVSVLLSLPPPPATLSPLPSSSTSTLAAVYWSFHFCCNTVCIPLFLFLFRVYHLNGWSAFLRILVTFFSFLLIFFPILALSTFFSTVFDQHTTFFKLQYTFTNVLKNIFVFETILSPSCEFWLGVYIYETYPLTTLENTVAKNVCLLMCRVYSPKWTVSAFFSLSHLQHITH